MDQCLIHCELVRWSVRAPTIWTNVDSCAVELQCSTRVLTSHQCHRFACTGLQQCWILKNSQVLTTASETCEVGTLALLWEQQRLLNHLLWISSRFGLSAQTVFVHGLDDTTAARRRSTRVRVFHCRETRHQRSEVARRGVGLISCHCHHNQQAQTQCYNSLAEESRCHRCRSL